MKFIVASDIHGDLSAVKLIVSKFIKYQCDKIILLGDYFGYSEDDESIESIFELYKNDLVLLRGNCDYLFDDNLKDYFVSKIGNRIYCFSHGNRIDEYIDMFKEINNIYFVFGHTHKNSIQNNFINLGSISQPRGYSKASYALVDDDAFSIFDLNDKLIDRI